MTHADGEYVQHVWEQVSGPTGYRSTRCKTCGWFLLGTTEPDEDVRSCPGSITVNVRLDGDYALRVTDVWPDGDWPEDITAEAVAEVMRACRSDLPLDWNLWPAYLVAVDHGPEVTV